jgi:hypothetical protein
MFRNFFKRLWITQEVVDYLQSIPKYFRVFYTIKVNKNIIKFPIRDEDGTLYDFDRYDRRVTGIVVSYQDFECGEMTYYVDGVVDKSDLRYLKERFEKFVKNYPITKSSLKVKELYEMQCQLRKKIESVTKTVGAYDGKDIVYNLSAIDTEHRKRILDTVARLGNDCVETTLQITISGSTDEEIGATLDELALIEAEEEQKFADAVGHINNDESDE